MSMTLVLGYIAACFVLAITPGPNMALIVATTLGAGLRAGLMTLCGTLTGLTILVTIAAAGMSSVMVFMSDWFDVVRWAGALYLIFLGARQLYQLFRRRDDGAERAAPKLPSPGTNYRHGLFVALSNPKVLLFLGAFFPQFIDPAAGSVPLQLAVLAVLFVATLALADLGYTIGVARARERLDPRRLKGLDLVSGALLVAGGLVLATARRP